MSKLKAVVTIAAWVLFIQGFLNVVMAAIAGFTGKHPQETVTVLVSTGIAALILACVAAWLRKKLE